MGRTPTTLTDPRTWMSVCRSGEPAIVANGAGAHTSGASLTRAPPTPLLCRQGPGITPGTTIRLQNIHPEVVLPISFAF